MSRLVALTGGRFLMGSNDFYPEERPAHPRDVAAFAIESTPVTNAAFARFVSATGHLTTAEREPAPSAYPDLPPERRGAGSAVFIRPTGAYDVRNPTWWRYTPGACWRAPQGPGSAADLAAPVVHVTLADAQAYAAWAGRRLPTEAEWEFAARGGLEGAAYAWGDDFRPGGRVMALTFEGSFPAGFTGEGEPGARPVGAYPANGYGLFDMTGNVWEWTADPFGPHGGEADPARRAVKGGSHLCAANYCMRYRPAARLGMTPDTSTSHVGFRCAADAPVA